jgi:type II secretory pathway predicted ATPase ExeA
VSPDTSPASETPINDLALAGRSDNLLSDDHHTRRGYPRAVNNLAIQALLAAFVAGKAIVDESPRAAVTEVMTE